MGTATRFPGSDVSKDTVDCRRLPGVKAREHAFANDPRDHDAPLAQTDRHTAGRVVDFHPITPTHCSGNTC